MGLRVCMRALRASRLGELAARVFCGTRECGKDCHWLLGWLLGSTVIETVISKHRPGAGFRNNIMDTAHGHDTPDFQNLPDIDGGVADQMVSAAQCQPQAQTGGGGASFVAALGAQPSQPSPFPPPQYAVVNTEQQESSQSAAATVADDGAAAAATPVGLPGALAPP